VALCMVEAKNKYKVTELKENANWGMKNG